MEHQVKTIVIATMAILFTFSACQEDEPAIISTESANQRFNQSMDWNKQHPFREIVVPSDDYCILCMSDSHIGGTKNLDHFLLLAKMTKSSAVVMVGDLTTGHSLDYAELEKHLPSQDSLPSFLMAGNHDEFFNGWKEFHARFGSSTYLFTVKTPSANDLLICLESGGATLGDQQLEWLTDNLHNKRTDFRRCLVFTHNNLFRAHHTMSTNPPVEELQVLIDLFTRNHVDMVITGHDHARDDCLFGITRYIQLDALEDGLKNAGYMKISIVNGTISYSFERI